VVPRGKGTRKEKSLGLTKALTRTALHRVILAAIKQTKMLFSEPFPHGSSRFRWRRDRPSYVCGESKWKSSKPQVSLLRGWVLRQRREIGLGT
jgi:hypothetical protein